jgi:hypothetical protein
VLARLLTPAALWLLILPQAPAAEIRISYDAMKRYIAQQVFTQDGRHYVKGTPTTRCSFAYLENPALNAENGSLVVKARFSGRSARNFFGRCLGLGDSFDVTIRAVPFYDGGFIAFNQVRVASQGRNTVYERRVRAAMQDTLSKQFKYPVYQEAKKRLEQPTENAPFQRELLSLSVPQIRLTAESLILTVDFVLAVK